MSYDLEYIGLGGLNVKILVFFKILFIYSSETQREPETQAEGEAGSMWGAQPDVGLDPRTPGSCPGPRAGL